MINNRIYRFFTSLKLTVILLTAIAVLCVLDTLSEELHLIHSVPMYLLGALFAVNLILCTVGRLGWARRQSKKKFRLHVWGSPVLHAGLIVVMTGAFMSWLIGRQTYYEIPVGETAQVAGRSGTLEMRIDDFRVEYYEDRVTPRQYITDLTITKRDGSSASLSAYVNGPARYDGVTVIQQNYGWAFTATLSSGRAQRTFELRDEEWIPLVEDETVSVRLGLTFYPDYQEGEAITEVKNMRDDNPRLLWVLTENDEPVAMNVLEKGAQTQVTEGVWLTFDDYGYYTGLQAKYDPGVRVIFTGFFLVLAGLVIRYSHMMKQEITEEK
ncbi:MAG: cytochrome c biogenesis protein ResB [Lachnospiraceae bacterium]|nr:cytochrome c biogenesis protein ResB [Lachnospiraceae bacterium]